MENTIKTIIITGAGTGIGAAAAIELAKDNNIKLVLIGRRRAKLLEVQAQLNNMSQHIVLAADVADRNDFHRAILKLKPESLNICGIFVNAGVGGSNDYDQDDRWEEIININLTGAYISIMETLPYLKKSSESYRNILITSSCLARFGVPNHTAYCASKTGLLGLTRALAVEHASNNILVNAILPGWVETEMAKAAIQALADSQNISYQESFDQQMSYVPLGKMSQPEELAKLVKFYMTNQQSSITGQCIDINNGAFMA